MDGSPGINKMMIPNKRVFIGMFSFYSFWAHISEDIPPFTGFRGNFINISYNSLYLTIWFYSVRRGESSKDCLPGGI